MAASDQVAASLAALNDREVEILRLLTAGHTIKSIATQLGRSEASINERLRDARRKTGVGSSRELARLLHSQKNWDRNPDLTPPVAPAEETRAPIRNGRVWSKGLLAMLTALSLATAGLVALAVHPAHQAELQAARMTDATKTTPLAGRWALDVARIPAEERPHQVTIAFAPAGNGRWHTVVDMVGPDGAAQHAESTAATDGVPVPISGTMAFIDSVALRQPEPGTLVMTLGKNGAPVSTRVYAVAKDHRTMTETIIWAGGTLPKLETTTFHRVD